MRTRIAGGLLFHTFGVKRTKKSHSQKVRLLILGAHFLLLSFAEFDAALQ